MQSKIAELLHQYFELGVAEGREGRNHDTEAGDAQRVLSEIEAEIAALSAAEPVELYNADALMNDGGDNRQTAAEEVLTYLLIEVVGAPDDVPYSANRAGALIEERLKQQPAPAVMDQEKLLAQVASIICEETCGLTAQCKSREAAKALYDQGYLSALSAQVQDVAGWQPIETAPHDTNVLLAWTDSTLPCGWKMEAGMASWGWRRDGVSNMSEHGQATHWMPLPVAPAKQEG